MSYMKRGDNLHIERIDGFSTFGTFQSQDDEYVVVTGTVGDLIGKTIIVPKVRIIQIIVIEKRKDVPFSSEAPRDLDQGW